MADLMNDLMLEAQQYVAETKQGFERVKQQLVDLANENKALITEMQTVKNGIADAYPKSDARLENRLAQLAARVLAMPVIEARLNEQKSIAEVKYTKAEYDYSRLLENELEQTHIAIKTSVDARLEEMVQEKINLETQRDDAYDEWFRATKHAHELMNSYIILGGDPTLI
jgi:adenylosuccinate synthase